MWHEGIIPPVASAVYVYKAPPTTILSAADLGWGGNLASRQARDTRVNMCLVEQGKVHLPSV